MSHKVAKTPPEVSMNLARFVIPSVLFATFAVLPSCASSKGENFDSAGDDLTSWEPATTGLPKWATPDRLAGYVDDDQKINVQIHLKLRNEGAAQAELEALSDPDSPRFQQYLSDEDFAAKYAPTEADIAVVRQHLEKYGLAVKTIPTNRLYVAATGSHAQVQKAFATKLAHFNVDGKTRRAPSSQPKVPRTFASKISSTLGLTESAALQPHGVRVGGVKRDSVRTLSRNPNGAKPNDDPGAATCSEWFGAKMDTTDPSFGGGYPDQVPYAPCGYSPGQLRHAYGVADAVRRGQDGHGVNIAIIDAYLSPTLLQDAQTYAAQKDPDYPLADKQFSIHQGPGEPGTPDPGWFTEATLDVEAVHAMAPGANIVYVAAQSPTDVDLVGAMNMIVEQKLATIVSNSYGSPEGQANDFVVWQAVVTHAGLKGVGIYFASGDSGDEMGRLGFASADFPASLPGVTAVGGTSLALGQRGERLFETSWETGASFLLQPANTGDAGTGDGGSAPTWDPAPPGFFAFGAGGGTSMVYPQPKYQRGVVPEAMANLPGAPARVVPDVAMLADPITGFTIGQTVDGVYAESVTGGTSLACPLFAGTMALVEQKATKPIGFANPRLYKRRATAFRDITPTATPQAVALPGGIMVTLGYPGLTINAAPGYDNVTGLGAPDGENFLRALK
jgi:subtilase family serine protease